MTAAGEPIAPHPLRGDGNVHFDGAISIFGLKISKGDVRGTKRATQFDMPNLMKFQFDAKPDEILTARRDTVLAIGKINFAGGRVTSMARLPGQQGRYRLSIRWPDPRRAFWPHVATLA